MLKDCVRISDEVKQALSEGRAVVALEATIIAHGMPYPQNVETAYEVDKIIRAHGGTATFARNAPRGAKAVLVLPVTEDPAAR